MKKLSPRFFESMSDDLIHLENEVLIVAAMEAWYLAKSYRDPRIVPFYERIANTLHDEILRRIKAGPYA